MKQHRKTIFVITLFAIAMAALESAVVVYLRALYYPGEFTVAFKVINEKILLTELAREFATIVMLITVGYLAGKSFKERLAYFLLSFAVWDIFYYLWLKVFINWPSSLFEWDILFLIPVTWLGPVLAPVICSLTMIILAWILLVAPPHKKIDYRFWTLLGTGCVLILVTFMQDYFLLLTQHNLFGDYANLLQNEKFISVASQFVPESYSWGMFWVGEVLILFAMLQFKFRESGFPFVFRRVELNN
jgi:hypothetical protein